MMKHTHIIIAAGGFALALASAMGIQISPAEADAKVASNSQLRGQYVGTNMGACLISLDGFDENNRPKTSTRTYSTIFNSNVAFTFDGNGRGTADFLTVVNMIVPGPNAPPVAQPGVGLSTGGGNFTYSVGPKNTVTVTLTDPEFKNLPALQSSSTIDRVVLEGHFGPDGVTLVKTDGAIEILTPSAGSPFPRICERSFVLLSNHSRSDLRPN
jgi:hypothetical protein